MSCIPPSIVSVLHPAHQLGSFIHFVFSPAKVSGFRKQATVGRKLSIKTSLFVLYINVINDFLVTAQEKMKKGV